MVTDDQVLNAAPVPQLKDVIAAAQTGNRIGAARIRLLRTDAA